MPGIKDDYDETTKLIFFWAVGGMRWLGLIDAELAVDERKAIVISIDMGTVCKNDVIYKP